MGACSRRLVIFRSGSFEKREESLSCLSTDLSFDQKLRNLSSDSMGGLFIRSFLKSIPRVP